MSVVGVYRRLSRYRKRTLRQAWVDPSIGSGTATKLACVQVTTKNATTTRFPIIIGYLSADHLTVRLGGALTTDWTIDGIYVKLDTAPAKGVLVEICRVTPHHEQWVTFAEGSSVTPTNVTDAMRQVLYYAEEIEDQTL